MTVMMTMMSRVMCVLAVVLCCTCGYTMADASSGNPNPYGEREGSHWEWDDFLMARSTNNGNRGKNLAEECPKNDAAVVDGIKCSEWLKTHQQEQVTNLGQSSALRAEDQIPKREGDQEGDINQPGGARSPGLPEMPNAAENGQGQQRDEDTLEEVKARGSPKQEVESEASVSADEAKGRSAERTLTTERQREESNAAVHGNHVTPSNTSESTTTVNSTTTQHSPQAAGTTATTESEDTYSTTIQPSPANTVSEESTATPSRDSSLNQQSPATDDVTAASESPETNTTTPPSTENTTTEAPTATPSPVPNTEISSTIASTVHNKANVDSSSISSVWMRTVAPLLIVVLLFTATVY
ncbi:uncharacterized protein TM35_000721200 [Trypanosoma theileri]|uniref:Mucin-associated surface protein (MASP) n=1 Tax=Trypanosoma theileri TaxID=67003 RepID=A0A1X0NFI6_9TRYP|nr:uncharacterized protein TM35_000721200 [Trypanosoma theileri]ORC83417.1 hypothetical protein TM35_000721200 [Trypanosoma theileri]